MDLYLDTTIGQFIVLKLELTKIRTPRRRKN